MPTTGDEPHAGARNDLTDVPGIRVGHHQRIGRGWRTGTTVVLPPPETLAAVDVRGGEALGPRPYREPRPARVLALDREQPLGDRHGVARGLAGEQLRREPGRVARLRLGG